MAAKCDVCGKMARKYYTTCYGDIVCSKACFGAYQLEAYLLRMEERRHKDEPMNKRSYDDAREMSALLSLYKFGNKDISKQAGAAIAKWWGNMTKGMKEDRDELDKNN